MFWEVFFAIIAAYIVIEWSPIAFGMTVGACVVTWDFFKAHKRWAWASLASIAIAVVIHNIYTATH